MRNLLALVGLAVVGFFGLGWYLGWYSVGVAPAPDGKKRISFDVDTAKMANDAKRAGDKVGALLQNAGAPPTAPATGRAPATRPDDAGPALRLTPEGKVDVKLPEQVDLGGGVKLRFPKEGER